MVERDDDGWLGHPTSGFVKRRRRMCQWTNRWQQNATTRAWVSMISLHGPIYVQNLHTTCTCKSATISLKSGRLYLESLRNTHEKAIGKQHLESLRNTHRKIIQKEPKTTYKKHLGKPKHTYNENPRKLTKEPRKIKANLRPTR